MTDTPSVGGKNAPSLRFVVGGGKILEDEKESRRVRNGWAARVTRP